MSRAINGRDRADRIEDRMHDRIETMDRRLVAVRLSHAEWRRIERSLSDRAEAITARLPSEPMLRHCALTEAQRCRDAADLLSQQLREGRA